jgi:hypothetical protein
MIIWDPEKSGINEEINILDYLGLTRTDDETGSLTYTSAEARKQVAEAKLKMKKKQDGYALDSGLDNIPGQRGTPK